MCIVERIVLLRRGHSYDKICTLIHPKLRLSDSRRKLPAKLCFKVFCISLDKWYMLTIIGLGFVDKAAFEWNAFLFFLMSFSNVAGDASTKRPFQPRWRSR